MEDELIYTVAGNIYRSLDDWPKCAVHGCENSRCERLFSQKCYPHTLSEPIGRVKNKTKEKEKITA